MLSDYIQCVTGILHKKLLEEYCHVSGVPWLIITGSALDDWIYWRLLCPVSLNYNQLQELTINLLPRTPFILVLILWRDYSVVLRCTPLYSHSPASRSPTSSELQFQLSNPRVKVKVTLRLAVYRQSVRLRVTSPLRPTTRLFFFSWTRSYVTPSLTRRIGLHGKHVSRVIKNACLLVRYLSVDILLLLRANFGNVFTDPLPINGHTRYNIILICTGSLEPPICMNVMLKLIENGSSSNRLLNNACKKTSWRAFIWNIFGQTNI
jgi:hypothetical protein